MGGNLLGGFNLGPMLGRKSKEFLAHWSKTGVEARRNSPYRCEATARRTGERCGKMPARGEKGYFRYCSVHLGGADRVVYDNFREQKHKRTLALGDTPFREARARKGLRQINATRLRTAWRHESPEIPGTTLVVADWMDDLINAALLSTFSISLSSTNPETGHPYTARCVDRLRHAAHRLVKRRNNPGGAGELFESHISQNIQHILRTERRYWEKQKKLIASSLAWDDLP